MPFMDGGHPARFNQQDRGLAYRLSIGIDSGCARQWRFGVLHVCPTIADRNAIGDKIVSGDAPLPNAFTRQVQRVVHQGGDVGRLIVIAIFKFFSP